MKKIINNNSKLLLGITTLETILAIVMTLAFVYTDSLKYGDTNAIAQMGIKTLLENMYSSTWWGLILFLLAFISIFSITSIVYKKMEYLFISILCWSMMGIIAINLRNPIGINIATIAIFVPVILIYGIAYKNQKIILQEQENKKNKNIKTKKNNKKESA